MINLLITINVIQISNLLILQKIDIVRALLTQKNVFALKSGDTIKAIDSDELKVFKNTYLPSPLNFLARY